MHSPPVSVIVVSRARPRDLARCLTGLDQLDYPNVELVVVACPAGQAAARAHKAGDHLKLIGFDAANISAARNLGLAQAAGEIVAFIDDDAVPEPLWLRHLVAPFADRSLAAATGYVIGRNGISFQWKARQVDALGNHRDLPLPGTDPVLLPAPDSGAIKTEGTNMAFRRAVIARLGGFDPGFHYYLDETDLNMRMARRGHRTAIVPLAQVHHGFVASAQRGADRTPRDLFDLGASQQLYLRKHLPAHQRGAAWAVFRKAQRLRLLRLMQRGPLGADDVTRLMRRLDAGSQAGADRSLAELAPLGPAGATFLPYPTRPDAPRRVVAGRIWRARALLRKAEQFALNGEIVSLFILSPTPRRHHARLLDSGVWFQRGGRFGLSQRDGKKPRYWRFSARISHEIERVAQVRGAFHNATS